MLRDDYSLPRALRPFSYVVALAACGTGVVLAWDHGHGDPWLSLWVMLAGLLLQVGVNLINDAGDLPLLDGSADWHAAARRLIRRHYRYGLACFALALLIGAGFVWLRGWPLLLLGLLGLFGAFAYTTEPWNYKRRGWAVPLVFWLMGVLMVLGSYYALAGGLGDGVFLASLPVSCLVSLLLLSNEMRDLRQDRVAGVRTLSVRLGATGALRLYAGLLVAAFALALGVLPGWSPLWLLIPGLLLTKLALTLFKGEWQSLPPLTGRLFAAFALGYLLALTTGG